MAYVRRWDLCVSSKNKAGISRSTKVGVVFEDAEGRLQVVIDQGVAISSTPSNFINGYVPREREADGQPQKQAQRSTQKNDQSDDDIPF